MLTKQKWFRACEQLLSTTTSKFKVWSFEPLLALVQLLMYIHYNLNKDGKLVKLFTCAFCNTFLLVSYLHIILI